MENIDGEEKKENIETSNSEKINSFDSVSLDQTTYINKYVDKFNEIRKELGRQPEYMIVSRESMLGILDAVDKNVSDNIYAQKRRDAFKSGKNALFLLALAFSRAAPELCADIISKEIPYGIYYLGAVNHFIANPAYNASTQKREYDKLVLLSLETLKKLSKTLPIQNGESQVENIDGKVGVYKPSQEDENVDKIINERVKNKLKGTPSIRRRDYDNYVNYLERVERIRYDLGKSPEYIVVSRDAVSNFMDSLNKFQQTRSEVEAIKKGLIFGKNMLKALLLFGAFTNQELLVNYISKGYTINVLMAYVMFFAAKRLVLSNFSQHKGMFKQTDVIIDGLSESMEVPESVASGMNR